MFLFSIRARVNPKSTYAKANPDVGGAYANCYISFKDYDGAEKLAKMLLRENGLVPGKDVEVWKLQRKNLTSEEEKKYYSEALRFGYCLVFHTWPKNADEADR